MKNKRQKSCNTFLLVLNGSSWAPASARHCCGSPGLLQGCVQSVSLAELLFMKWQLKSLLLFVGDCHVFLLINSQIYSEVRQN